MIKEAMTKYPDVCYAGIDISKKMIKIAKRNVPHAEFIVCDANNLPFKDNSISSIIYAFTLTTLPDYKGSLKESMRILKNEGKIGIMDGKKPSGKISCFIFFFIKYTAIVIGKTYFGRDVISYILNFKNLKTLFFKSFFMGMSYVMIVQIRK
jgi:ubiquinone/menaquinone biosynthesis C-methylase UbiE